MLTNSKFAGWVRHKPPTTVLNRTMPWSTMRGPYSGTLFDFVKHSHGKALANLYVTMGRDLQWYDMAGKLHQTEVGDTVRKIVEDVEQEYGDKATFGDLARHLNANITGGAIVL